MFFVFSLGKSSLKKLLSYFPGTVSKFVSGLTHLTWQSSEEANTCSMSTPLDKSAAKQRDSEIKFQCFFSTEIKLKFKNYIYRLLSLMVSYSLVETICGGGGRGAGEEKKQLTVMVVMMELEKEKELSMWWLVRVSVWIGPTIPILKIIFPVVVTLSLSILPCKNE